MRSGTKGDVGVGWPPGERRALAPGLPTSPLPAGTRRRPELPPHLGLPGGKDSLRRDPPGRPTGAVLQGQHPHWDKWTSCASWEGHIPLVPLSLVRNGDPTPRKTHTQTEALFKNTRTRGTCKQRLRSTERTLRRRPQTARLGPLTSGNGSHCGIKANRVDLRGHAVTLTCVTQTHTEMRTRVEMEAETGAASTPHGAPAITSKSRTPGRRGGLSGSASRAPSCPTLATGLRLQRDSMEGTCQVTGATQSLAVTAACVG